MTRSPRTAAAIVGAGLMGHWHAVAATRAGARVAAVVDSDPVRAGSLASRYRGARAVRSLEEAVDHEALDVAHVCTPLETHASLARAALRAGLHVLIEKPLVASATDARALLTDAERAGRLLCPVHQFVFQRGTRRALEALSSAGAILHIDAFARSAGADGQADEARDRVAAEILPHALAIIARVAPEELASARWSLAHPAVGELRAVSACAHLTISLLVSMRGRPTVNTLTFSAERATIHLDCFHGFAVVERGRPSRRNKVLRPFTAASAAMAAAAAHLTRRVINREFAYPGLTALTQHFYRAIRDEASAPFSSSEILLVAEAWDAVRAAPDL